MQGLPLGKVAQGLGQLGRLLAAHWRWNPIILGTWIELAVDVGEPLPSYNECGGCGGFNGGGSSSRVGEQFGGIGECRGLGSDRRGVQQGSRAVDLLTSCSFLQTCSHSVD